MLMAFLYACTGAVAQAITISLHHVPLRNVLDSIQKKSRYTFNYSSSMLEYARVVDTIDVQGAGIEEVLAICFKNQPLSYVIDGTLISIRVKPGALKPLPPAMVNGWVLNERNEPVEGVTVQWKGVPAFAVTDGKGFFSLRDVKDSSMLLFSGVNIEPLQQPVIRGTGWKILVHTKASVLSPLEIVSTGYQDINVTKTPGSFFKVDSELLNRRVSATITEHLQDVTSALNFEPQYANIEGRSPLMIRGISTIHANMGPLVVVDNFPYSGDINHINPNDIESVTVLKDAVAAAIWGVQAGNGVIVIVTKKGKFGQRARAHLVSSVTVGGKPDLGYFPVVGPADYAALEQRLFESGFYDSQLGDKVDYPVVSQGVEILQKQRMGLLGQADAARQLAQLRQYDVRGDVGRYFVQNSASQQYAVNASGGTAKFSYYCSLGYDGNRGNNVGNTYSRLTARSDNIFRPLPHLELSGYMVYTKAESRSAGIDYTSLLPTGVGEQLAPYTRLADDGGHALAIPEGFRMEYLDTIRQAGLLDWHYRPLDELRYRDQVYRQSDTRLGAGVKYGFGEGISAEVKYQYEKGLSNSRDFSSLQTWYTRNMINQYMYANASGVVYPVPVGGIADFGVSELSAWNLRAQLGIKRDVKKNLLTAFAGAELREVNTDVNVSRKYGYDPSANTFSKTMDYNTSFVLRPAGQARVPDNDLLAGTLHRYLSFFARMEYLLKNKYSFSFSSRVDESNFFGVKANQRRVPLWSAGAGWQLSAESFYHMAWLPYLRLRATYGYNGNTNNNATAFATVRSVSPGASSLIPVSYSQVMSPPNPELRWEKIKIVNFGADFANRSRSLTGSIEYYLKTGLDLISQVSVDPTTGFTSYTGNNASVKGRGVDIVINTRAGRGACKWTGNFLLSYTTDKVVSYQQMGTVFDYISGTKAPYVGRPLFSLYSYQWAGLDPVSGDPRAYAGKAVADYLKVGGKATPADLVYDGPTLPRFFGSFRHTFYLKSLSLSLNITYKLGYYFRRSSVNYYNLLNNWGGHSDYMQRWQQPGDEVRTNVPSLPVTAGSLRDQVYLSSDILSEKADHIRLRDIRLGYDLNRRPGSRLPVEHAQVYIYINNIGILWKANKYGIDPDYGSGLIPAPRTVAAGISIDF